MRMMPTKKAVFNPKILEFVRNISIILNDFCSKSYSAIKIWVKFIFAESPKNPEMRSTYEPVYSSVNQISYIITSYNVIISFNIVI